MNILNCGDKGGVYFSNTGGCYVHSETVLDWYDASREFKKNGGDLATIANQDTHDFLVSFVNIQNSYCWIGAERNSGVWSWADGTPWTGFEKWNSGEPDKGNDNVGVGLSSSYKWYDWVKTQTHYYLCQY